jgi:hypothetical protein
LTLEINNGKAQEVQGLLQAYLEELQAFLPIPISVVTEGPNKLVIGLPLHMLPYDVLPLDQATIDTVQSSLKVN